jgi:hypothetical protein
MIADFNKTLTKAKAVELGYTLCGYEGIEEQTLIDLGQVSSEDYVNGVLMLAEKEGIRPIIKPDTLAEVISEHIYSDWAEINEPDAEQVYQKVKSMDFTDMAEKINKRIESHVCYVLTDIRLIP